MRTLRTRVAYRLTAAVVERVRREAERRGITATAVVEQGLRESLLRWQDQERR